MGGSLALALRPWVSHLTVVDTDPDALAAAESFADEVTGDLAKGIGEADLIVLATPVRTILNLLRLFPKLRGDGCMILDLGSTKREISSAMSALPESFQAIESAEATERAIGQNRCLNHGFAIRTDLIPSRYQCLFRSGKLAELLFSPGSTLAEDREHNIDVF